MNAAALESEFVERLRARWAQGAAEYGDQSFAAPPAHLLEEMLEEAVDIAGWALPLYHRLRVLQMNAERFAALEAFAATVRHQVGPGRGHAVPHGAIHRIRAALTELDTAAVTAQPTPEDLHHA